MNLNYAILLDNLISKEYLRETVPSVASQYLYRVFIDTLREEATRMRTVGIQLREQANRIQTFYEQEQP